MVRKSSTSSIANDFYYCICSGSFIPKSARYNPLVCKTCRKYNHRECVSFSGNDEDFECTLCKIHLLDPFNTVDEFLWFSCIGNSSFCFVVDASNLRKWRSNNKDVYMACIPLNKDKLQHEWPKTFNLKINSDTVHVVKEPSWEHKRRDNPIKITYAMRTGENIINIVSSTYNENEPLFLLVMFVCKQVTVNNIVDYVKKNYTISYEESRDRVYSILNTKIGDDEIVCMENTHKMDLNCPVTLDKILIPTRGRFCRHIQCYDLMGYLKVMERTSAFNMRWKCPECHLIVKPHDLVVDTYVEKIISEFPNTKTIELDKELNYKPIIECNTPKSGNKPESDDEKVNNEDYEYTNSNKIEQNSNNLKNDSENLIELVESDDHNVEVICISDDEQNLQESVEPKFIINNIKNNNNNSNNTKTKSSRTKNINKKNHNNNNDDTLNKDMGIDKRKRRRKLKKPPDIDSQIFPILDSTLVDCVNTFNQRSINSSKGSTPSYDKFVLNPPVLFQQNDNHIQSHYI